MYIVYILYNIILYTYIVRDEPQKYFWGKNLKSWRPKKKKKSLKISLIFRLIHKIFNKPRKLKKKNQQIINKIKVIHIGYWLYLCMCGVGGGCSTFPSLVPILYTIQNKNGTSALGRIIVSRFGLARHRHWQLTCTIII